MDKKENGTLTSIYFSPRNKELLTWLKQLAKEEDVGLSKIIIKLLKNAKEQRETHD